MTMQPMRDIPLGCSVYTSDAEKLGTVKEVRNGAFKVDAHMQPDYWLPSSAVASTMTDGVTLSFNKDHLGDFKAGSPEEVHSTVMTTGPDTPIDTTTDTMRHDTTTRP